MKRIAMITAVAIACISCAHAQRPESSVYVVSKDATGVGAALAMGGSAGRSLPSATKSRKKH